MAQMYAALKMKMGNWDYYSVRMKMSEAAKEIMFASEVNDDKTLDNAIQRVIQKSRAGTQIVNYLAQNDERFFNSLVVAALDGNPTFNPVSLANEPKFEMIADMFTDTFGVLTFDETIKTYALDGQHRLFAIKSLVDGSATLSPPVGFSDETINVIFVVPSSDIARDEFLKSYRRLFSSLNRHAKTTSANTNIIMDEDDRFAIVTRRLFSDFDFFKWNGHDEDPKIDTEASAESLNANSTAWATLVGLYRMNITLLWDYRDGKYKSNHELIQQTPTDDEAESLYNYLDKIWDAILLTVPVITEDPSKKRRSGSEGSDGFEDNLLFRPIGQTGIVAPVARRLLNQFEVDADSPSEDFVRALKPLSFVNWNLQSHLWRDLLTVQNAEGNWTMRAGNNRSAAIEKGRGVLTWLCGLEDLSDDQLENLKQDWSLLLEGPYGDREERESETFDELIVLRRKLIAECY